jgi:hypothetical protein
MTHRASVDDRQFRIRFEKCEVRPADFDHRAHVSLAWTLLTDHDVDTACQLMRDGLQTFLRRNGIEPSKYHETMTRAWIMAVRHFMERTAESDSAASFIEQNPQLLDSKIMLTHYSVELLFSDEARARFVQPDRVPIPGHGD